MTGDNVQSRNADKMVRCLQWLEKRLSKVFHCYGKFIARRSIFFLVVPLIVAAILSCGIFFIRINNDTEYLFVPENGAAKEERKLFSSIFPPQQMYEKNMFFSSRQLTLGLHGLVIITAKDGGSVLRPDILNDTLELERRVKTFTIEIDNRTVNYEDVCTKTNSQCSESNVVLMLTRGNINSIESLNLTYPVYKLGLPHIPSTSPFLQRTINMNLGSSLGDVKLSKNGFIESAHAMTSLFSISDQNKEVGEAWEDTFLETMQNLTFDHIQVCWTVSRTPTKELDNSVEDVTAQFSTLLLLVMLFSIFACMMFDSVLTKPWLGCLGVLACVFAVASSYGALMYCGVEFILIAATVPFLSLAIGVDDMFVLLAAWRRTDPRHTVEERMGNTFQEAGVSITITTLTDFLGFMIGAVTMYPAVRIFCMYMGVAILFDFFYQITFFGACIVYTGRREAANRHAFLCSEVPSKRQARKQSLIYRLFYAGGYSFRTLTDFSTTDVASEIRASTHKVVLFFRDYYSPFLEKLPVKVVAVVLFLGYITISIWGCMQMKEGLELKSLALDGSYAVKYFEQSQKYFRDYYIYVGILINEKVDYSTKETLKVIDGLLCSFEKSGYFHSTDVVISWIHDFWKYADVNNITVHQNNFNSVLKQFLQEPAAIAAGYPLDIVFDEEASSTVVASRIYVQSKDIYDSVQEKNMMVASRDITMLPKYSKLNLTVFSTMFFYYDQYVTIVASTLQNLGIVSASMLAVSFILIPDPVVSVWVFLSIVSICTGVMGFMTFWHVSLDAVAMVNLISSVGFSVDFSAHIAYSYTKAKGRGQNTRMSFALVSVGLPIVQGALSTLVGIFPMSFSKAYVIRTFFKIMFLVITFGSLHALLFLPILLSLTTRRLDSPDSDVNETSKPQEESFELIIKESSV